MVILIINAEHAFINLIILSSQDVQHRCQGVTNTILLVHTWLLEMFHNELTQRFIPTGYEVPMCSPVFCGDMDHVYKIGL